MVATFRTASFGQRAAASLIDGILFAAVSLTLYLLDVRGSVWIVAAVGAVYQIGLTATIGQTLGKRMIGTRVVVDDASTIAPPPGGACVVRWLVLGFPVFLPEALGSVAGFIILVIAVYGIATDERARGIHDHLANTRVIEAP